MSRFVSLFSTRRVSFSFLVSRSFLLIHLSPFLLFILDYSPADLLQNFSSLQVLGAANGLPPSAFPRPSPLNPAFAGLPNNGGGGGGTSPSRNPVQPLYAIHESSRSGSGSGQGRRGSGQGPQQMGMTEGFAQQQQQQDWATSQGLQGMDPVSLSSSSLCFRFVSFARRRVLLPFASLVVADLPFLPSFPLAELPLPQLLPPPILLLLFRRNQHHRFPIPSFDRKPTSTSSSTSLLVNQLRWSERQPFQLQHQRLRPLQLFVTTPYQQPESGFRTRRTGGVRR